MVDFLSYQSLILILMHRIFNLNPKILNIEVILII